MANTKSIDEIIEGNLEQNIELKFCFTNELLENYSLFSQLLSLDYGEYRIPIIAEFKFNKYTYKFYIDVRGVSHQLWIYVVNDERYIVQRHYVGNINPNFLLYFENVIKYTHLFDIDNVNRLEIHELLYQIKVIGRHFDTATREYKDVFSEVKMFKIERIPEEPAIIPQQHREREIFSIGLGLAQFEDETSYSARNICYIKLILKNDYYFKGKKIEEEKKISELVKNSAEIHIDKYFSIDFSWDPRNVNKRTKFVNEIKAEYSKHYFTLNDGLSDSLKLIEKFYRYLHS